MIRRRKTSPPWLCSAAYAGFQMPALEALWSSTENEIDRAVADMNRKVDRHGRGLRAWARLQPIMNDLRTQIERLDRKNPVRAILEARWLKLRGRIVSGGPAVMYSGRGWQNDLDALQLDARLMQTPAALAAEPITAPPTESVTSNDLHQPLLIDPLYGSYEALGGPLADSILSSYHPSNLIAVSPYKEIPAVCSLVSRNSPRRSAFSKMVNRGSWGRCGITCANGPGEIPLKKRPDVMTDEKRQEQWRALTIQRAKTSAAAVSAENQNQFNAFVFSWEETTSTRCMKKCSGGMS